MTDPNVQTTPEGETVVLEPGDPGYVSPDGPVQQTLPEGEPNAVLDAQPMPADVAPPQDLTYEKEPGESDAEFLIRSRQVVESESPTDIVPNMPQIRPFPTETGEEVMAEGEMVVGEGEAVPETMATGDPPAEGAVSA